MKGRIETLLREQPGYGYRRVALALAVNKKRAQRVMRLFGIKAYRRRGRRFRRARFTLTKVYPNLLLGACPSAPGQVWVSDFTRLLWRGRVLYLATVLDLFTREIVGWSLQDRHAVPLVLAALFSALLHRARPGIFHSDNGREYDARVTRDFLAGLGIAISRSHPGCPWENGYQEAFYSQFRGPEPVPLPRGAGGRGPPGDLRIQPHADSLRAPDGAGSVSGTIRKPARSGHAGSCRKSVYRLGVLTL